MEPIQGLIKCMLSTRNRLLKVSGLLFSAFLILSIIAGLCRPLPNGITEALFVLAAFFVIAGLYLLILAATISNPTKHPVIKHLKNNKREIVWVYSFISINMPFGVHMFRLVTIWLHYRDGSQQHLRISHKHLEQCMLCLKDILPHATFGHSVANEQLYRANPELLDRD